MPKVSVIVPVYGVEKYIERCARSLFEQTLDDIEYIFVDDCTPDRSIDILKALIEEYRLRFAEMNYKVRIERMPTNSGLPAVRRHGIQLATGDYIIHCDSDDWVDRDMYRQMYEKAIEDGADMVVCDYFSHNGICINDFFKGCRDVEKVRFLKDMMSLNISWAVWNKLVKRTQYEHIKYYPSGAMGEDMVLSIQLCLDSNTISYINTPLYYYFSNPSSITKESTSESIIKKFYQYCNNYIIVETFIKGSPYVNELKKLLQCIQYSVKSSLYSSDKTIQKMRKGLFPCVEYKVLFFLEISKKRRKEILHNIVCSLLKIK